MTMKKLPVLLATMLAAAAAPSASAAEADMSVRYRPAPGLGQMIYSPAGGAILAVYKVTGAGEPRVIIDGKVVTIPAATLSLTGNKLTTTLSRTDLRRMARR